MLPQPEEEEVAPNSPGPKASQEELEHYCRYKLASHVALLGRVQNEMFSYCSTSESHTFAKFTSVAQFPNHSKLYEHLRRTVATEMPDGYSELYTVYAIWSERMAKSTPPDPTVSKPTGNVPRFLASLFLLYGEYYLAIECLFKTIQLDANDVTARSTIVHWAIFLVEWQLASALLDNDRDKLPACGSQGFEELMTSYRLTVQMNAGTAEHQAAAVEEMLAMSARLEGEGRQRTFFGCCSKVVLSSALAAAAKLPNADISKIGDPLNNLRRAIEHASILVSNRYPEWFNLGKSCDLQTRMLKPGDALALCTYTANYLERNNAWMQELIDAGLMLEAESHALNMCKHLLLFGVPYRLLRPLGNLVYLKTVTKNERFLVPIFGRCVMALFLKLEDQLKSVVLPKTKSSNVNERSVVKSSSELTAAHSDTTIPSSQISSETVDQITEVVIERHPKNCHCYSCLVASVSWSFVAETAWLSLLVTGFAAGAFREFESTIASINKDILSQKKRITTQFAGQVAVGSFPPMVAQHYLHAIFHAGSWTKTETLRKVDKIIGQSRLTHRAAWLAFRHLPSADQYPKLNYSWLAVPAGRSGLTTEANGCSLIHLFSNFCVSRNGHDSSNGEETVPAEKSQRALKETQRRHASARTTRSKNNSRETVDNTTLASEETEFPFKKQAPPASETRWARRNLQECEEYAHLFFREWHRQAFMYAAAVSTAESNDKASAVLWQRAFCMSETSAVSVRQQARYSQHRRRQADNAFFFRNTEEFRLAVLRLPADFTVVHLALDENQTLWLLRYHGDEDPFIIPIYKLTETDPFLSRLKELLADNETLLANKTMPENAQLWWKLRRQQDAQIRDALHALAEAWFGPFAPLMLSRPPARPSIEQIRRLMKQIGFSEQTSAILANILGYVDKKQWSSLVAVLAEFDALSASARDKASGYFSRISKHVGQGKSETTTTRAYTLLIVPPQLSFVPWEYLPVFEKMPFVSRVPAFHFLDSALRQVIQIPKEIDCRNTFFVLNPGAEPSLEKTQQRLTPFLANFSWTGITGAVPSRDDVKSALMRQDLFVYLGHGSGKQYIGRSTLQENGCNAVVLLMGCGSVRITDEGPGYDGRSIVYDYLSSRSPCVVGCLWTITDGELDRFFMTMAEHCFAAATVAGDAAQDGPSSRSSGTTSETYRLLMEGMVKARKACKLRYLTGGAVIAYGLPVASLFRAL